MTHSKKDYFYTLPESLIAQKPSAQRDQCKLLNIRKSTGELSHHKFPDIINLLSNKSTIIFNDTKVIPARIPIQRYSGGIGELFIEKSIDQNYLKALAKPSKRLKEGEQVQCLKNKNFKVELIENYGNGKWKIKIDPSDLWPNRMDEIGEIPLPPYIKRPNGLLSNDHVQYQTVFGSKLGSVAAPTASLHFTEDLISQLSEKGINIAYLTHHVGLGTFLPIRSDQIEFHQMHEEFFHIPSKTCQIIQKSKAAKEPIIAVGTTVVRALESAAEKIFKMEDIHASTELFIYPPYSFKIVDQLITNFHLPESTLLMLVSAFANRELILKSYHTAIDHQYRFFSYGDAMYIH